MSRKIRFKAHELLKSTNRMTNGRGYEGLKAALERLDGSGIRTNIITGGQQIYKGFGRRTLWLDELVPGVFWRDLNP